MKGIEDPGRVQRPNVLRPDEWLVRLRPREQTISVSRSRTVLSTGRDGFISGGEGQGLWIFQTRMMSRYRWLVEGKEPAMVANSNVNQHTWLGYYITSPPGIQDRGRDEANASQQTIELRLTRIIADGMHEDVEVTNFTQNPTSLMLELDVDTDFADHGEVEGRRQQKGALRRDWRLREQGGCELLFEYEAEHHYRHQDEEGLARLHRSLSLRVSEAGSEPQFKEGKIAFSINLPAHGRWHACIDAVPMIADLPRPGVGLDEFHPVTNDGGHNGNLGQVSWDKLRERFLSEATEFTADASRALAPVVIGALKQARRDLENLRLYDLDSGERAWVLSGGVPTYVALFGRDSLAAAWESSVLGTEMMRGAATALPRWQGTKFDDWRDEQPDRLPHEAHTGPLSALNFSPHGLYYGGVTASIYYPTVVATLWHWTGDKEIVRPLIEPALRGMHWADRYGDLDNDGFYEYQTYSTQGEKNQGWKDSGDAIVYEDGSQVEDPLGTCEMQAFVYASKLFLSETLWWMDMADEARRLYREAEELKKRFNDTFWMDDLGYIAMALDSKKKKVRSIASDPGHCIASGIVDESRVQDVADRLMARDMFSGWGIRTLSAEHPAYNPYAYHRGTVWPVENAVFALGFARYGLHGHVNRLSKAQFEVAGLFDYCRLPECFTGHERDQDHPFPAVYPKANWPQAWSSSAVFSLIQAMLGIYPYAPLNLLMVDPWLPEWLPQIALHHLRVGKAAVSINFHRNTDGATDFEVLEERGHLHVLRQPSPWSLTAGFGERVKDMLESLLPGK